MWRESKPRGRAGSEEKAVEEEEMSASGVKKRGSRQGVSKSARVRKGGCWEPVAS